MHKNSAVTAYIDDAPLGVQPLLKWMRAQVASLAGGIRETLEPGMVVYTVNARWTAGFAYRQKGPMLYIMDEELLDRYKIQLGKRRSGKSCIRMNDELQTVVLEILSELQAKLRNRV